MYIYRIYNLSDECYIGSTIDLKRRWQQHKSDYKRWKGGKVWKCNSLELFDKYGVGNCFYELLETVEDELQLKFRERYWIEFYGDNCVNKYRPVITEEERKEYNKEYIKERYENNREELLNYYKEYYENNREKISNYYKEYHENNREQIAKQMKEYYKNNREKIAKQMKQQYTCECGSTLTKSAKAKHERSIKHKSFIQSKQ